MNVIKLTKWSHIQRAFHQNTTCLISCRISEDKRLSIDNGALNFQVLHKRYSNWKCIPSLHCIRMVSVCLSSDNLLTTIFNKCFVITSILSSVSMCLIVCLLRDGCKCICVRETADKWENLSNIKHDTISVTQSTDLFTLVVRTRAHRQHNKARSSILTLTFEDSHRSI